MRKFVRRSIIAIAVLLASGGSAAAQSDGAPWRPVDAATGQIDGVAGLEQLARDFPDSGSVRLRLLNALLQRDDFAGAWRTLSWLLDRGHRFAPAAQDQLLGIFAGPRAEQLAQRFAVAGGPVTASQAFAQVPAQAGLVEGVAIAPATGAVVVTSVVSRQFWGLRNLVWQPTQPAGLGNPSGLAMDPQRGMWVASGDLGMVPAGEVAFAGLFHVGPPQPGEQRGEPPGGRIPAPAGVNLSDIALGADGTVYASDPLAGGVYWLRLDGQGITPLVAPGLLRSPQGLAESSDRGLLYVSDYRYGLALVELGSGTVSRLTSDVPVLLDGIDGLWIHNGELIGIQNGTSPRRIVALQLSPDGRRVIARRVLEQDHPEWTEPLGGAIAGDTLYYIANGQWDRYGPGGVLVDGATPEPTQIRSLPLTPALQMETP